MSVERVRTRLARGGAARDGGEHEAWIAREDGGTGEGATPEVARELARLDGEARRRGVRLAEVLAATPVASVPVNAVVDDVASAQAALARGVRALKVKLGDGDDRARLSAIRTVAPAGVIELRGDVNQRWPRAEVAARLAALADLDLAYVEEPAEGVVDTLTGPLPVPIGLDESLTRPDREAWLDRVLATGAIGALVLKPTRLGVAASLDLARRARAAGVDVIVTHDLDGPVGTAAAVEVARALGCTRACGLDWPAPRGRVAPAPPALGLVDDAGALTWDELAAGPPPDPVVIATPGRATVAAIARAMADARPIGLVHARLAAAEQATLAARLRAARVPDGTLATVFTSGSTGEPRAVVIPRRAALAAAAASAVHLGWRDDDRWLLALPLAHVGGLAVVVRCLLAGQPVVLPGDDGLAAAIERHRVTLASLVPTQLEALVAAGWRAPAHLRAVLVGGAAAPPALIERALALGIPALTTYGMTETFGQVATATPGERLPPSAIGRALPGVRLTAGTRAAPAPIVVEAPSRCGYLDAPGEAGPLTTSDLGFVEDGLLYVVGRADDVIITGGENVHPLAVEAVLVRVPGVAAACVYGIPDERWGQRVAAAIVPGPGFARATLDAALDALAPHQRPREVRLVSALPLNPTGKVDRRALARGA